MSSARPRLCEWGYGEHVHPAGAGGWLRWSVDAELALMMTALRPLAYGYLRDDLIGDRDRDSVEEMLRDAARLLGYQLGTVFHEPPTETGLLPAAFVELLQECRRAAAHTVITLAGHMSMSPMVLQAVLQVCAQAVVHEIEH
ncbi:hypothetical protein AB0E01_40575 [Nocardia vinacea]|uniref:hypothetical protein n=1 Tax=Nocardia vinacea TaxID=96468 RepID=UPI0033F128E2